MKRFALTLLLVAPWLSATDKPAACRGLTVNNTKLSLVKSKWYVGLDKCQALIETIRMNNAVFGLEQPFGIQVRTAHSTTVLWLVPPPTTEMKPEPFTARR